MRIVVAILVFTSLAVGLHADAYGECLMRARVWQYIRGVKTPPSTVETIDVSRSSLRAPSVSAYELVQRAALQQALVRQQMAQQMARRTMLQQARFDRYARSRETARQRRAAEVARREERRTENLAKRERADSHETLVVLRGE